MTVDRIVVNTREEAIKKLSKFEFKYFVPYHGGQWRYCIEISQNNNVLYCYCEKVENNLIVSTEWFYDYKRAYNFDTKEVGEKRHKDNLEYKQLIQE